MSWPRPRHALGRVLARRWQCSVGSGHTFVSSLCGGCERRSFACTSGRCIAARVCSRIRCFVSAPLSDNLTLGRSAPWVCDSTAGPKRGSTHMPCVQQVTILRTIIRQPATQLSMAGSTGRAHLRYAFCPGSRASCPYLRCLSSVCVVARPQEGPHTYPAVDKTKHQHVCSLATAVSLPLV